MRHEDDRWPSDAMQANAEVKDRFIELLEALWLFLTAFGLWLIRTAAPQLWRALQAIWQGVLAVRWGVPRMWRQLTIPPAALPGLEKARAEELAKLSFSKLKETNYSDSRWTTVGEPRIVLREPKTSE